MPAASALRTITLVREIFTKISTNPSNSWIPSYEHAYYTMYLSTHTAMGT